MCLNCKEDRERNRIYNFQTIKEAYNEKLKMWTKIVEQCDEIQKLLSNQQSILSDYINIKTRRMVQKLGGNQEENRD